MEENMLFYTMNEVEGAADSVYWSDFDCFNLQQLYGSDKLYHPFNEMRVFHMQNPRKIIF